MKIAERNNKLKHFITCLKCEVSGKKCDVNCPTQYDAGNMGEIIENLEAISKALEHEPTTKNDLGVDAVSRKAVHDMLENLPITVYDEWFNWLQKACLRLADLPSVTPQEPKTGHWIEIAKYSDGNHKIECSECGSHIFDRGHANSFNVKNKYKYCPNCGIKMVESQERNDEK